MGASKLEFLVHFEFNAQRMQNVSNKILLTRLRCLTKRWLSQLFLLSPAKKQDLNVVGASQGSRNQIDVVVVVVKGLQIFRG